MNEMGKRRMMLETVGGERGGDLGCHVQLPVTRTNTGLRWPPFPAAVTRMGAKQAL